MASSMIYTSSSSTFLGFSLLLVFFLCFSSSWNVVNGYDGMVGGRREVKDVKNKKEVQEIGRFCVEKYNKNQRHYQKRQEYPLEFKEVVKAQTQVVSGFKYYLTICAFQDGISKVYDAIVVVKPWIQSKQLITFAPSINSDYKCSPSSAS
ncbi:cysteine proteinase inhibitor 4-like [Telopea speciosissima]|uniref:cysteine proteinase inhibitor 4-like n=1 Tax=Telopea speciosissima TaxID=54955 RepID=UPI001CC54317|nr:cysteine proteinase inhibitor 4-like [Telopea speciosissima]